MNKAIPLKFVVNGKATRVSVPPMKRLLDVLREDCRLTGTKEGCGEGECGACTVLIDGHSVNSCLVPAFQAEGRKLITVEGLAKGRKLTLLQQAFVEMGGSQCGICTPGILVSAFELLTRSKGVPSEDEVREALAGNLCRCTGYQKIVDSVRAAAGGARRVAKARKVAATPKKAPKKATQKTPKKASKKRAAATAKRRSRG